MLRSLVALLLVPLVLDAVEIPVSEPRFGPAQTAETRLLPFVASGDGVELVAWEERLFGAWPNTSRILIRTFGADGEPRQRVQVRAGDGVAPRAVWNGTDFFVAYGRYNSRFGSISPIPAAEGVRVTADGVVLEGTRTTLLRSTSSGGLITGLAWDGAHYLAGVAGDQSRTLLLDRDGRIVREIPLAAASIVALPGGGFAVLRIGKARIDIVRVSASGEIGDVLSVGALANFGGGLLAIHGDAFGVVWKSPEGIAGVELDANGHVLTSTMFPPDAILHSLAWREGAWMAAYRRGQTTSCIKSFAPDREPSEICRDRVADPFAGATRSAWVIPAERDPQVSTSPRAGFTDGRLASETAAVQSSPDADGGLVAWIENGTLRVGPRTIVTAQRPSLVRLATAGDAALLVFAALGRVHGVRLDRDGAPIGMPFEIGRGYELAVASNGSEWLVAWNEAGQIQTARVTANGEVFPAVPLFPNAASQRSPAVTWTGAGYLVAWAETEREHRRVLTQLADASGNRVANAVTPVDRTSGAELSSPAVECRAESCLVTWIGEQLEGAIVTPSGATEPRGLARSAASRTIIALDADDGFRVFIGNRAVRVTAAGEPFAEIVWTGDPVTVGGVANGRLVYERRTRAGEELGGVTRVFTRELPPTRVRTRAVQR